MNTELWILACIIVCGLIGLSIAVVNAIEAIFGKEKIEIIIVPVDKYKDFQAFVEREKLAGGEKIENIKTKE